MDGTGLKSRPKRVDRSYQLEIFEKAKTENVIACLPTGTGKTHIASLLIRYFANEVSGNFTEGGKRIFFLVPQKVLVKQQADEIRENTAFDDNEVRELTGNQNVDSWQQEKWNEILNSSKVLVMTAQILENMLKSGFIKTDQICLIIFDEIHHAAAKKKGKKTDHVYRRILDELRKGCSCPRLLGLTASVVNNKIDVDSLPDIIKDLEDQFLKGQCFTVSMDEVEQYKTNAKMVFWQTAKPGINQSVKEKADILAKEVQEIILYLDFCKENKKRKISLPINSDDLKKALRSIQKMLKSMGIWMSQEIAGLFAKDLENTARDSEDFNPDYAVFLRQVAKYFMGFKDVVKQMLTGINLKVQLLSLVEPKPKRLLQILENYSVQPETFKGIVFVEERLEAMLLSSWIKKAIVYIPSLEFVKVSYLVGYNNRPGFIDKSVESAKEKQEQTMKDFRKGECNLLVSTSVLEEGLDVPECNCIIRYYVPQIFRQWQQSKGRARAKNAHYYMIVEEGEELHKKLNLFNEWVIMEAILGNYCVKDKKKRDILAGNEYEDWDKQDSDYSIFTGLEVKNEETGARITHETAIGTVNAYLQQITSDAVLLAIDEFKEENGVYCTVKLPLNTVIHEDVRGLVMTNRKDAKKAVYLKICQMLKDRDALDEHLKPYPKKVKAEKIMKELALNLPERHSEEEGPKPGSRKRKQFIEKRMSDYFKADSLETSWFLYQIVLDDKDSKVKTGILVPKELPLDQLPSSFIIYKRLCPVEVKIHFVVKVNPTPDALIKFIEFHKYIFGTILDFPLKDILCDEKYFLDSLSQMIVVPIDEKRVDVGFIDKVDRRLNDPLFKFPKSYSDYENFLVTRNYGENYQDVKNIPVKVKKVLFGKSPFSEFDNLERAKNYVEYYKDKYGIELKDKKQPLLQVEYCEKLSGLLPKKAKHMVVHLIPELVDRHPIEASLYEDLSCFPALLYRLNQLLLADSFRRTICREVNLGQEEVPVGFFKQLTFPSIKRIEKARNRERDYEIQEDRVVVSEDCLADSGRAWNEDGMCEMSAHDTDDENTSSSSSDNEESEEEPDSGREGEKTQNLEATVNDSNMMYDSVTKQRVPKFDEFGRPRLSTAFGGWDPMRMKLDMLEKTEAKKPKIIKANQHSFLIEFNSDISDSALSDLIPIPSPDKDKMTAAKNCFKEAMKKLEEMEDGQFNAVEVEIEDNFLKGSTTDEEAFSLIKSFDKTASVTRFSPHGIPPSLYIEVFSASSAYDLVNSERLETLGDSFLKWCISDFLYSKTAKFPELMEGHLTLIKGQLVSNFNLYRLAVEKELNKEIITHHFMAPRYNWMPPGFVLNRNNQTEEQSDQHPKEKQLVSDKKIADSIEALIGAIILCRGIRDAAKFIQWFGLASLGATDESGDSHHWLPKELAFHPNVSDTEETKEQLNALFERSNLKRCEEILNYSFQDKAFLVKATTHPSNYDNRITGGNQKLEFLGDAVLDFLITRYIFEVKKDEEKEGKKSIVFFNPGQLTDLRSALTNNAFLAITLIKYQLHKHLSCYFDVSKEIKLFYQRYLDAVKSGPLVTCGSYIVISKESDSSSENSGESNSSDEPIGFIEAPKILGDLFESILGAIYLDSNRDMDIVWKVVYGLIKEDIAQFIDKIPINPVRKVHEEDAKAKFTKRKDAKAKVTKRKDAKAKVTKRKTDKNYNEPKDKDTRTKAEIELVFKDTTFIGRGRNRKLAKISASIQGLERFNLFA